MIPAKKAPNAIDKPKTCVNALANKVTNKVVKTNSSSVLTCATSLNTRGKIHLPMAHNKPQTNAPLANAIPIATINNCSPSPANNGKAINRGTTAIS